MSTRSSITLKVGKKYMSNYCHWDGYVSYVGEILFRYYDTYEKVSELMSYGDISSLDETIESCVFYHRDRNESLDIGELEDAPYNQQGFDYVFEDGEWYLQNYSYWDDITDEETEYVNIKLSDALYLEMPDKYKNILRKRKLKRLINKK